MNRSRVAILGATGYGGGELLRLLLPHPDVEVVYATSRSQAGMAVGRVHRNLLGLTDLEFSAPTRESIARDVDVVIGALPHGASAQTLAPFVDAGVRVLDLSGDFRLRTPEGYRRWYRGDHPRADLLAHAVYGIPELHREQLRDAALVASPGCFATALNLCLLPLAAGWQGGLHAVGMTGSSGSGADPGEGTHHPTRAQTLRPYKVLSHQHVGEVLQLLALAGAPADAVDALHFTPVSAPLVRGIVVVVQGRLGEPRTTDQLEQHFRTFYAGHPFVKVLTTREPEAATVATTNFAEVRVRASADGGVHVICAIDNLVKGGAGQAVQNLNLMLGLEETTGLTWSGTWP